MYRFDLSTQLTLCLLGAALLLPVAHSEVPTDRPDYRELDFPEPAPFTPPSAERRELANGMVVYVLEDPEFPVVSFTARIRTGTIYESKGKLGLAEITGELMRQGGTEQLTPDELDVELEDMASSVETSISSTSGSAAAWTLLENLERTTTLFADVLRRPRFAQEKLELMLKQARTAIQARNDDASQVTDREFGKLIYGKDHPLARVTELSDLENITREDVVKFHSHWYVPNHIIIGVVGAIKVDAAVALLEKQFGTWERRDVEVPALPAPTLAPAGIYYADVSEKKVTQSVVRIGHIGVRRDTPDYPALVMLNYILGGSGFGTNRLLAEVRTNQGLAYSVYSSLRGMYDHEGQFFAGCETKAPSTVPATRAILAEIERIRTEPVAEEELASARREFLNSEVFNYDAPSEILTRAITCEYSKYPQDLLETTLAALRKVTPEDVLAAAKKHLHTEKLVILAVGDKSKFVEPLELLELGPVTTLDISIPVPDKRTEVIDFENEGAKTAAKELATKVIEAAGGEERIRATKSMRVELEMKMAPTAGRPEITIVGERRVVSPDRVRFDATVMGMMQIIQVATDTGGWMKAGPQVQDMPEEQTKELLDEAVHLADNPWLKVLSGELEAAAGGTIQEGDVTVRLVGLKEEKGPTIYYVDPATGHILRMVRSMDGARTETAFSEWQDYDGRQISTSRQQFINGDLRMTMRLTLIEVNPVIDPAIYERPE